MVNEELAAKGGGYLFTLLGSTLLGISIGLGIAAALVRQRLNCVAMLPGADACQEIMARVGDLILASAGGGAVVFGTGLVALWMVYRDGESE